MTLLERIEKLTELQLNTTIAKHVNDPSYPGMADKWEKMIAGHLPIVRDEMRELVKWLEDEIEHNLDVIDTYNPLPHETEAKKCALFAAQVKIEALDDVLNRIKGEVE